MIDKGLKKDSGEASEWRPEKRYVQSAVIFSDTNRLAWVGNFSPITVEALQKDPAIAGRKMCFDASFFVLRDIVAEAIPARTYTGLTAPQVHNGAAVLWALPKKDGFYQALAEGSDISLVQFESKHVNTVYVDAKMQVAGRFAKRILAPVRRMAGFNMAEIERRFPDFYPVLNSHCLMQASNLVVTFIDFKASERLKIGGNGKLLPHKIYAEALEDTINMRYQVFKAVVTSLSAGTSPEEKADARSTLNFLAASLHQTAQQEEYPHTAATHNKKSRAENMLRDLDNLIAALPSSVPMRADRIRQDAPTGRRYAPA